jgi:hypothetical protein
VLNKVSFTLAHFHSKAFLKNKRDKMHLQYRLQQILSQISLKYEIIDASKTGKFKDPSLLRCYNVSTAKYFPTFR